MRKKSAAYYVSQETINKSRMCGQGASGSRPCWQEISRSQPCGYKGQFPAEQGERREEQIWQDIDAVYADIY